MYVLIHGAYHGAWCWTRLRDRLEADGVRTVAPDLPGHGRDPGWLGDQTMAGYAARIVETLDGLAEPAILIGHSMGGAVAALAADARPDKVARIVFVTAYIPADGESVGAMVKADPASFVAVTRVPVGDIEAVALKKESLADAFYNDAESDVLALAEDHVQMQSPLPFRHRLELGDGFQGVPKAAIVCTRDRAISPPHQRWMAARVGADPIVDLDTGHSPFLTAPDALADLIGDLAPAPQSAATNFR